MQYRITDPYLEPPGVADDFWSEQPVRLPHSFWCYAQAGGPATNSLPALPMATSRSPASTTSARSTTPCWRLGQHDERAERFATDPDGPRRISSRAHARCAQQSGIARERVKFVGPRPALEYLAGYHHVDVAFDSFPYGLTPPGLMHSGWACPCPPSPERCRSGARAVSHLCNLNLPELIAKDPEHYVKIMTALCRDLPRLAELRPTLRERMQNSPLMNATLFARSIEDAYRHMWRRWCG